MENWDTNSPCPRNRRVVSVGGVPPSRHFHLSTCFRFFWGGHQQSLSPRRCGQYYAWTCIFPFSLGPFHEFIVARNEALLTSVAQMKTWLAWQFTRRTWVWKRFFRWVAEPGQHGIVVDLAQSAIWVGLEAGSTTCGAKGMLNVPRRCRVRVKGLVMCQE